MFARTGGQCRPSPEKADRKDASTGGDLRLAGLGWKGEMGFTETISPPPFVLPFINHLSDLNCYLKCM